MSVSSPDSSLLPAAPMQQSRAAGVALIAGALAGVVTMSFHPTAHDLLQSGDQAALSAWRNQVVHWLALGGIPLLIFGFLGLSRRLDLRRPLVSAAFITYCLASIAVMCAAIMSGLVATALAGQILEADSSSRPVLQALLHYTGQLNRGFATVYVAGSSAAAILWSVSILRTRALAPFTGTLGCIIGGATLAALGSGHLRLGVHGFLLVVVGQTIWTVIVGGLLCRTREETLTV